MGNRKRGMPVVNAMVLADSVYRDEETRKFVIAGTFNELLVSRFPALGAAASMYVNLSDFSGTHGVSLRFVSLSNGKQLGESTPIDITQDDRLSHCEIHVKLPPLTFPEPGKYALELLWDGHYLQACKITASMLEQSSE